jgi:hypothetical protein
MDNRSLATDRPLTKKGRMVAGYPAPPDRRFERLIAYKLSDRFAVESLIGLPWNQ